MPFADYQDFDACVKANSDKEDPEAYCAVIKRKVEEDYKNKLESLHKDITREGFYPRVVDRDISKISDLLNLNYSILLNELKILESDLEVHKRAKNQDMIVQCKKKIDYLKKIVSTIKDAQTKLKSIDLLSFSNL